jgi:hypothetical protein
MRSGLWWGNFVCVSNLNVTYESEGNVKLKICGSKSEGSHDTQVGCTTSRSWFGCCARWPSESMCARARARDALHRLVMSRPG